MASMSISLPDKMRVFIKSRLESGDYHNESEYIRDLIRRDRERLREELALLDIVRESEQSGLSKRDLSQIIADAKGHMHKNGDL